MPWGILLVAGLLIFLILGFALIGIDSLAWTAAVFWIIFTLALILSIALLTCHTAVSANIIQFGMDQLHDSPMEDSVLFIVWFIFTLYLGFALFKLGWIETV